MAILVPVRLNSVKFCCSFPRLNPSKAKTLIPLTPLILSSSKLSFLRTISMERISTKAPHSSPQSVSVSSQPIEDLPPNLQHIVGTFQSVQNPKSKYEQLLFYGKNITPLDAVFKTDENKVQGCVSQVWVRAFLDDEKFVRFEADSDSVLTKGLAALLVQGLSGLPVEDVLRVSPDFVALLGLRQSLTPSRNNGFLNMLRLMQKKAFQLLNVANAEVNINGNLTVERSSNKSSTSDVNNLKIGTNSETGNRDDCVLGVKGEGMKEKLNRALDLIELVVEDVSYQHAGHAGLEGNQRETHFNVKVVSKEFEGKSLVKRHRLIYGLLQEELDSGLHALSIVAKTPSEVNHQ